MKTKNALRVHKFRTHGGNEKQKKIYKLLRLKYGLNSVLSNKLKFRSIDNIISYLRDNDIKPLKSDNVFEEVDRL